MYYHKYTINTGRLDFMPEFIETLYNTILELAPNQELIGEYKKSLKEHIYETIYDLQDREISTEKNIFCYNFLKSLFLENSQSYTTLSSKLTTLQTAMIKEYPELEQEILQERNKCFSVNTAIGMDYLHSLFNILNKKTNLKKIENINTIISSRISKITLIDENEKIYSANLKEDDAFFKLSSIVTGANHKASLCSNAEFTFYLVINYCDVSEIFNKQICEKYINMFKFSDLNKKSSFLSDHIFPAINKWQEEKSKEIFNRFKIINSRVIENTFENRSYFFKHLLSILKKVNTENPPTGENKFKFETLDNIIDNIFLFYNFMNQIELCTHVFDNIRKCNIFEIDEKNAMENLQSTFQNLQKYAFQFEIVINYMISLHMKIMRASIILNLISDFSSSCNEDQLGDLEHQFARQLKPTDTSILIKDAYITIAEVSKSIDTVTQLLKEGITPTREKILKKSIASLKSILAKLFTKLNDILRDSSKSKEEIVSSPNNQTVFAKELVDGQVKVITALHNLPNKNDFDCFLLYLVQTDMELLRTANDHIVNCYNTTNATDKNLDNLLIKIEQLTINKAKDEITHEM